MTSDYYADNTITKEMIKVENQFPYLKKHKFKELTPLTNPLLINKFFNDVVNPWICFIRWTSGGIGKNTKILIITFRKSWISIQKYAVQLMKTISI